MRWLEVRRHSLTKKGLARGRGSHLYAQEVALARAVGAELGPIAYVLTSTSPRARLGFADGGFVDVEFRRASALPSH